MPRSEKTEDDQGASMRLLYLMVDGTQASQEELQRKALQAGEAMPPGATFCPRPIPIGPQYYRESAVGLALCVPGILEATRRWQDEFDAILIGCFVDPGVRAARTVSRIPVVGAGQGAMAPSPDRRGPLWRRDDSARQRPRHRAPCLRTRLSAIVRRSDEHRHIC